MKRKLFTAFVVILLSLGILAGCSEQTKTAHQPETVRSFNNFGYTIAVEVGTPMEAVIKEAVPNASYIFVDNASNGFLSVKSGQVDAYAANKEQYFSAVKSGMTGLTCIDEEIGEIGKVAAGISPKTTLDNADELINGFIAELKSDGTLDDMYDRWETKADYTMPDIAAPVSPDKTIRIGTTGLAEPYTFYAGIELSGVEIEVIKRFAVYANAEIEISTYDWSGIIAACASGKVDYIFSNLFDTEERRESIRFSEPYLTVSTVLVIKDENKARISGASDINGKNVGVVIGSVCDKLVEKFFTDVTVTYYNSESDLVLALKGKKVDAFLTDLPVAQSIKNNDPQITYLPDMLMDDYYGYIFAKSEKGRTLKTQMNEYLKKIKSDGTTEELEELWIGSDESNKTVLPPSELDAKNGTLRFATCAGKEPFVYIGNGDYIGYDIDLVTGFCKEYGYGLEIYDMDFAAIVSAVSGGKCDFGGCSMSITEERKQSVDFSDWCYHSGVAVIVRTEDTQVPGTSTEEMGFFASTAESFNKTFIRENRWLLIASGLKITIVISVSALIIGTLLGFCICSLRRSRSKVLRGITTVFIQFIQGIPLVVLLMALYYIAFASTEINGVIVAIIGFSINFGVNVAEMIRSGIDAVDKGQWEASSALGFGKSKTYFKVVLPQAIRHFLPAFKGEFINMMKMTSVVGYIAVQDLTKASDIIRSRTYEAFFPLIAVALIYFILAWAMTALIGLAETEINPGKRLRKIKGVNTEMRMHTQERLIKVGVANEEVIRIEHLKKVYPNTTPLCDVNASIRRGEVISVIGASGTGKSTFLRMINCLEAANDGTVTVLGMDMSVKKNQLAARRRMGMVFQEFNLFPHLTVAENIMLAPIELLGKGRQEAYEQAIEMLSSVGLVEKVDAYPDELSGGQKQRAAIARTLAMKPEIILFDEPTSALDPTMVSEVLGVISSLAKQGMTMIIVTHEMRFARDVSTRIFYMDEGVIYEEGSPKQIFGFPQKEKTRNFIFRIRAWEYAITTKQFDYYGMIGSLEEFCMRQFLTKKQLNHVCIVIEELVMEHLLPSYKEDAVEIHIMLSCGEEGKAIRLNLSYNGLESDPLADDANEFSDELLKKFAVENLSEHTMTSSEFEILG